MIPASAASGMRWDGDTRGHGVANGEWIAPEVEALVAELRGGDWIAEEPESHLGKHLREACDAPGSPWTLHEAALGGPVFAVTLEWSRPSGTWRELRADAYALKRCRIDIVHSSTHRGGHGRVPDHDRDAFRGHLVRQSRPSPPAEGQWSRGPGAAQAVRIRRNRCPDPGDAARWRV